MFSFPFLNINSHCIPQVYTTAVFREALRLFTPILRLAKHAHADATLTGRQFTPHLNGHDNKCGDIRGISVAVPKGSVVMIDISGLHMNRACFLCLDCVDSTILLPCSDSLGRRRG